MRNLAELDLATYRPGRFPPLVRQISFGLLCTLMFILVRSVVDQVAPTAGPFALIYPAVLTATLFGRWQAGSVTYVSALLWTWLFLLPRAALLQLAKPADVPRTIVNAGTMLFVLIFAEVFRRAIRRASTQRDAALRETAAREAELRELNQTLEARVEERSRRYCQSNGNLSPGGRSLPKPELRLSHDYPPLS